MMISYCGIRDEGYDLVRINSILGCPSRILIVLAAGGFSVSPFA
jgi:hypothetical protein